MLWEREKAHKLLIFLIFSLIIKFIIIKFIVFLNLLAHLFRLKFLFNYLWWKTPVFFWFNGWELLVFEVAVLVIVGLLLMFDFRTDDFVVSICLVVLSTCAWLRDSIVCFKLLLSFYLFIYLKREIFIRKNKIIIK